MANREQRRSVGKVTAAPGRVEYAYKRSVFARVIHADGAIGGLTPQLNVHMGLYSEHTAAVETTTYILDPVERIAKEVKQPEPKIRWVREIEADIILSLESARSLRDWLTERLDAAAKTQADPDASFTTRRPDPDNKP